MAYAVVHGSDETLTPCPTATECLELVKLLEAQSEPIIRIRDEAGASMKLGRLEALHRQEVEDKNAVSADASASAPSRREGPRGGGDTVRAPIVAALLALTMLGVTINAVSRYRDEHRVEKKPQERYAEPTLRNGPQTARQAATSPPSAITEPPISSEAPRRYRIQPGDTLAGIAGKTLRDPERWRDIVKANPGLNPHHLGAGIVIMIPSPTRAATPQRERIIRGQAPHASRQPRS